MRNITRLLILILLALLLICMFLPYNRKVITISGKYRLDKMMFISTDRALVIEPGAEVICDGGGIVCHGTARIGSDDGADIVVRGEGSKVFHGIWLMKLEKTRVSNVSFNDLVLSPLRSFLGVSLCNSEEDLFDSFNDVSEMADKDNMPYVSCLIACADLVANSIRIENIKISHMNPTNNIYKSEVIADSLIYSLRFVGSRITCKNIKWQTRCSCFMYSIYRDGNAKDAERVFKRVYNSVSIEDVRADTGLWLSEAIISDCEFASLMQSHFGVTSIVKCVFWDVSALNSLIVQHSDLIIRGCIFSNIRNARPATASNITVIRSSNHYSCIIECCIFEFSKPQLRGCILSGCGILKNVVVNYAHDSGLVLCVNSKHLTPNGEDADYEYCDDVITVEDCIFTCKGQLSFCVAGNQRFIRILRSSFTSEKDLRFVLRHVSWGEDIEEVLVKPGYINELEYEGISDPEEEE